ncbi:hypothetical protein G6F37_006319 [Rhizopus arrhizus]|nr:hypothetical protein G6F38_009943 [Rhizopus arrhizus]KAG1157863.1 hypothetical protein G6F37_006319 [Rhizopus arrhizus]
MNDDLYELPTFRRNETTYSTIDYIFVDQAFRTQIIESNLHKLDASWTDHSLLSATCCLDPSSSGPGLWRGTPLLTRNVATTRTFGNLALKVNVCWQKAGEKLVKYLGNLYRQRIVEQHITALRLNDFTAPVECIYWMLPVAQQFYWFLLTTDPVDGHQVEQYLADIQLLPQLTDGHTDHLLEPITIDKIIHETARVENKVSSPGEDGLGYAFLYQLF